MKRFVCTAVALAAGCSTASKDIAATYVSPMQYQPYNCEQMSAEGQRIQTRVTQLGGRLDEAANNDKAITGVGIVLFWPALFFLGGTKQQEAEYARLSGEYQALQQAAVLRNCPGIVPQQTAQQGSQLAAPQPTVQQATTAGTPVSVEATPTSPLPIVQPASMQIPPETSPK
jgi:hypothetical protein